MSLLAKSAQFFFIIHVQSTIYLWSQLTSAWFGPKCLNCICITVSKIHAFCCTISITVLPTQRARKFKNSRQTTREIKYFFREIAFLAVLNFLTVQNLIFGHFWNCKKWNLVKKISWNWFIWFHEFFWPGLFSNFWPTVVS